jgi:hypothetical protein
MIKKDLGEILSNTFKDFAGKFKSFAKVFSTIYLIPYIILLLIIIVGAILLIGQNISSTNEAMNSLNFTDLSPNEITYIIIIGISFLVFYLFFSLWTNVSYAYIALKKEKQPLGQVLRNSIGYFGSYLIYTILIFLLMIGFILIPVITISLTIYMWTLTSIVYKIFFVILSVASVVLAIILIIKYAILFSLSPYLIVDKNLGAVEAMKKSSRTVKTDFWKTLGFVVIMGLIVIGVSMGFGLLTIPLKLVGFYFPVARIFSELLSTIFSVLITTPLFICFFKNLYQSFKESK